LPIATAQDGGMRILGLAFVLPLAACTLHFDDGDDTSPPVDPPPVDPPPPPPLTGERLIIGTQPSVNAEHLDWADVWVNYPALDCEPVSLYGAQLAVLVDDGYQRFLAESGAIPGMNNLVTGWLSLERDRADQLWRVTAWEPGAGGTQPDCYRW
jgi:hypothetical protein